MGHTNPARRTQNLAWGPGTVNALSVAAAGSAEHHARLEHAPGKDFCRRQEAAVGSQNPHPVAISGVSGGCPAPLADAVGLDDAAVGHDRESGVIQSHRSPPGEHLRGFEARGPELLGDVPRMAQPALVDSLCGLSRQIGKKAPEKPKNLSSATYVDTQAMIDALFDSLARFEPLLGRPSVRRPNFTHMTTHTEALLNLELMGYRDLVKAGHAGHVAHISAAVPEFDPNVHPQKAVASLESIMAADYWDDDEHRAQWNRKWNNTDNRNGYWIAAGHLFKVLYSYHRLIARVKDDDKVRLCSRILLERYFNPAVNGG